MDIADWRREYDRAGLAEEDLRDNPLEQLRAWLDDAQQAELPDASAMVLATASVDGMPDGRVVLLKGIEQQGLTFYTNYQSRKARQLEANPRATAVFFWAPFDRQVRVAGTVSRIDRAASLAYFRSRPYGSQIAAWASAQSDVIASRAELEQRVIELQKRYPEGQVPLPENWGGYRLTPQCFEFWQGRPSRLHDRLCYVLDGSAWRIERLSP